MADRYTDEELFRRYQAGEPARFGDLVERYAPELYRFLVRFVGNPAAAEDLVQETLLQMHQSAGKFDPSRRLRPWLFTIAANKARDWLRSQRRRTEVSLDADIGRQAEGSATFAEIFSGREAPPEEVLSEAEQRETVRRVVDQLPANLREVLLLGYFQQLPYKQIAEVVGVPVGTVKSRLHAAIKRFAVIWRQMTDRGLPPARQRAGGRTGTDEAREQGP